MAAWQGDQSPSRRCRGTLVNDGKSPEKEDEESDRAFNMEEENVSPRREEVVLETQSEHNNKSAADPTINGSGQDQCL